MRTARRMPGQLEMTALLALSMALTALGIDLMLPAFGVMREDLGLAEGSTATAGLVTAYFIGLALGQLVYGPVSDRYGRRPTLYAGYGIYAVAALACALAPSLGVLLVARVVWGVGAAGPRVVTQAVIRDTYAGDAMARAMSFVMAVFVLVPILAPSIGAAVIELGSWRWIFAGCVVAAAIMALWALRLPETLHPEYRLELRFERIARAGQLVVTNRQTLAYTLSMTALYGAFTSYIASSEAIIGETFNQRDRFPLIFGAMGAVIGIAMLANTWVVARFTARRVVHGVFFVYLATGAAFSAIAVASEGRPHLGVFLAVMAVLVSCHALLIPNSTSIAMVPMAAIAGTAASLMGATTIAGGALLGSFTDRAFDGTIRPLAFGFFFYGVVAFAMVLWGEGGKLFRLHPEPFVDDPALHVVEV